MENLQNHPRGFFRILTFLRNLLIHTINMIHGNINFKRYDDNINSESKHKALIKIKKKIRRSRLKETIELFTEVFLLLLSIMLLLISIFFFFGYQTGIL